MPIRSPLHAEKPEPRRASTSALTVR